MLRLDPLEGRMMIKPKTASILILTLWMLSFMTIFTIGLAYNVSGQLRLASHVQDRLKMYYLAKAGIERATIKFEMDETPNRTSLNEEWSNSEEFFKEIPFGGGYITVSYQLKNVVTDDEAEEEPFFYGLMDESSKININKAPLQILKSMLKNIGGVETEEVDDIANAIIDWRDIDVIVSPNGAEDEYYEGLKVPYPCKNGDFQIPEELLLVKGMTPDIFSKIAGTITIYGEGKVNINTADWQTFHALGLSSELAQRIVQFRRGRDEIDGTEDDNIFNTVAEIRNIGPLFTEESVEINSIVSLKALTVKSNVFRINSTGVIKKGDRDLRMDITCVVKMLPNKNPETLYWHEGVI
jgi:general secretion pathway protein K